MTLSAMDPEDSDGGVPRVFSDEDFAPGHVVWNSLYLDESKPLAEQLFELCQDRVYVRFDNGCTLDISWLPDSDPTGSFYVSVDQMPEGEGYEPFLIREFKTVAELRPGVREICGLAAARPSILVPVIPTYSRPKRMLEYVHLLDRAAPLKEQDLPSILFSSRWSNGCWMTINWEPTRGEAGELTIRLEHDARGSEGYWIDMFGDGAPGRYPSVPLTLLKSISCTSVREVDQIVEQLEVEAFKVADPVSDT